MAHWKHQSGINNPSLSGNQNWPNIFIRFLKCCPCWKTVNNASFEINDMSFHVLLHIWPGCCMDKSRNTFKNTHNNPPQKPKTQICDWFEDAAIAGHKCSCWHTKNIGDPKATCTPVCCWSVVQRGKRLHKRGTTTCFQLIGVPLIKVHFSKGLSTQLHTDCTATQRLLF